MNFDLKKPCTHCPFRNDIHPFLTGERTHDIIEGITTQNGTFTCHETNKYDDETGEPYETEASQHCAGALIMLEHMKKPSQMMRMAERLGLYDRHK